MVRRVARHTVRMNDAKVLLDQLTMEEKVGLVSGESTWHTMSIPRLEIGRVKVTDGPNGARGDSVSGSRAVCLPASIGMAATFDADQVVQVGQLLGEETVRKGSQVLLAPTINIARHPLGGRNFESFGEEPFLTSLMAKAFIDGVQSRGVGACAKHLVANDVEFARLTVSSEVEERPLREVYLAPFEVAADSDVWSMMAAYPKLNGEHCTQHRWLLEDLLRDEWGYDGLVMSDWGATHGPEAIVAGMDLEMPGPSTALAQRLMAAVQAGEVPEERLDRAVVRVLELAIRSGRVGPDWQDEAPEQSVDLPEERAVARALAADGMVLLKNEGVGPSGPVLPLQPGTTIAVVGPNADPGVIQGGGSAQLPAHHLSSPYQGLGEAFGEGNVSLQPGCVADRYLPLIPPTDWDGPISYERFDGTEFDGPPLEVSERKRITGFRQDPYTDLTHKRLWSQRYVGQLRIHQGGLHRFSVLAVGRSKLFVNGELVADNWSDPKPGDALFQFASAEVVGSVELEAGTLVELVVEWATRDAALAGIRIGHQSPLDEDAMMDSAVAAAAEADVAVVVVGLNADWETESHDRPMFGLPGRQDELVRRVMDVNPRTAVVLNAGSPVDLPWFDSVPALLVAWYPGQEFGGALADVLSGAVDPGGRLPITFPKSVKDAPTALDVPGDGNTLHYSEGLFVGHRWYDARVITPLAAFGSGLSYTTFEVDGDSVRVKPGTDGAVGVTVPVQNTGTRAGKAVLQVYVVPPEGPATRPLRSLGGVAVARLDSGERCEVGVTIPARAFEIWDRKSGWMRPPGVYRLCVGTSSQEKDFAAIVKVPGAEL